MKFLSFCGASVLDDTVSFCSECGKSLSISAKQPEEKEPSKPRKEKGFRQLDTSEEKEAEEFKSGSAETF